MRIEVVGISYRTSSIEVRDRASLGADRLQKALKTLAESSNIEGAVILSTCNRTEVYLSPFHHHGEDGLRELFCAITGLARVDAEPAYIYRDEDAVGHLFRVSAGLDSQMLGEVQILAQVKDAYQSAMDAHASNSVLNKLFLRAIETGKSARSRTEISQGAVSVASAAVEMATRIFGTLQQRNVLLVGAGKTARLAAKHLQTAGVAGWRVSNRTEANAHAVADLLGGRVAAFPPTSEDLAWADIVVSATSSSDPVLTRETVRLTSKKRHGMQLLLDLAVPRDMDPAIRDLPDAYLYTVDDFEELVAANLKAREREAARAEKLVNRLVDEFSTWYRENRVAPTIQQLQTVLEELRRQEVEQNARRFAETDQEQVEKFSRSLMRKVTSLIVANLKRTSMEEDDLTTARALTLALASDKDDNVNDVLEKLDHELSH